MPLFSISNLITLPSLHGPWMRIPDSDVLTTRLPSADLSDDKSAYELSLSEAAVRRDNISKYYQLFLDIYEERRMHEGDAAEFAAALSGPRPTEGLDSCLESMREVRTTMDTCDRAVIVLTRFPWIGLSRCGQTLSPYVSSHLVHHKRCLTRCTQRRLHFNPGKHSFHSRLSLRRCRKGRSDKA